ncbi:MAG: hypothetical protein WC061_05340 [Melioribacteraceae bacterium]
MKTLISLGLIIILFLLSVCTSVDESVRTLDRFSTEKVYAVLPFECIDKELAVNLSKELSDILIDYGFRIIPRDSVITIIINAGLTEEIILKDYTKAIKKLKGLDGIIIGSITMERGLSSGRLISSSASGSYNDYVSSCESQIIDLKSGETIGGAWYKTPSVSTTSGSITPAFIADKLARKLSPH